MNALKFEWTLLTRSKPILIAVIILSLLSIFAVGRGLTEAGRQRDVISHLESLQKSDMADLAKAYGPEGDAGYVAYYSFFHTFDPPSNLAFAALGQRDVLPYNLRVRALGLQAQLYEGDIFNPELALPGRFDLSFVLIYLAPLFLVVLLHDLVSHEAETGRLNLLRASPKVGGGFWARRAGLRGMLIWAAVAVPFMAGAMIAHAPLVATLAVLGLMALYVAFWTGLCLVTSAFGLGSRLNTLALLSQWMVLVLIAPVVAHIAISRAVPVPQGVDIVLKQRQTVHGAWEVPKVLTMERFFQTHPEWKNTPPLGETFEWKWYFAFHQLGDETVSSDVQAYRDSIKRRQDYAQGVGFFLPSVGTQLMLERLADTDIKRYLGYQQQVADFHTALRHFYYPYIFNKVAFHETEFAKAPRFEAKPYSSGVGMAGLVALLGLTALIWWAGLRLLRQRLG